MESRRTNRVLIGSPRSSKALACVVCVLLLLGSAAGLDPSSGRNELSHPHQYVARIWQTEQGLPQNSVNAILQDHQGYLWVGTFGGLARFDGERFTVFSPAETPGFASARILSLRESRSGDLWIGTVDGGLTRLRDGVAVTYTERDGLPSNYISSIREDAEGNLWINTARGIARFAGAKLERYDTYKGRPVTEFYLQARDGAMWFRSPGAAVVRFGADGTIATMNGPGGWRLREARDGSVWLASAEQYRLVRYYAGVFTEIQLPPPGRKITNEYPLLAIANGSGGNVAVIVPAGVMRTSGGGKLSAPEALPWPSDEATKTRSLLVDSEGNLWAGTLATGLVRFRPSPLTAYGKKEGLSDLGFNAVFRDRDGRMWQGGDLLYWSDGHEFHLVPGVTNLRTIAQTRDGDLWFGGYGGLQRWRSGVLTQFAIEGRAVRAIYEDRQGTLWMGALMEDKPGGLYRFHEGKSVQITGITDVRDIVEDRDGNLWVGGLQGLWQVREGQTVLYNHEQGLSNDAVYDLYEDSTGTLWVATYGGGLNRFRDGHFKAITVKEGLPNNMLVQVHEDTKGNLWISSNQNIFRFRLKELNDFLDGKASAIFPVSYGVAEGMRSSECNGGAPAGWRTPDGRLWFATLRGVVAVDPDASNQVPPPVMIEEAWANKLTVSRQKETSVPPGNDTFDFRFTALSFAAPDEVRFKYRLEPFDKNWVDAGGRRTAHYTNMPPGKYSFQVIAANSFGVWNEKGASVRFVLQPHFYQTNWFVVLCVVSFLALLWAAYQLRVRQLAYQFNMRLEERVGERSRIARDLHDTLLQSFQALLPRLQAAIYQLPESAVDTRKTLEVAVDQASEAITEGRDAVQGLRMSTVEKNDLAAAIRTIGEELASTNPNRSAPKVEVVVEGTVRNLHPILRDEVYRVAVEALRNACRHASAQTIEVEIRYDGRFLRLRVRDDGKGIGEEVLRGEEREGHYGLHGMRERAELAGGKLTIWSEVDSGTEVELIVPASVAYAKLPRRFLHLGKGSTMDTHGKETIERE